VFGPLLGVVPMALLGAMSWLSLRIGDGRTSGLLALVAGVSAAPGLLFVGAPFADDARYPMAILASVPMWLLLGLIASRRATRSTVASWRDYWREMTYLTVAVVLGAIVALAAATKILDESLVEWQIAAR
jgi:Na+/melibiose symporter-like transporter